MAGSSRRAGTSSWWNAGNKGELQPQKKPRLGEVHTQLRYSPTGIQGGGVDRKGWVRFRLDDGKSVKTAEGDLELRHIEHGWAFTVHAFQDRISGQHDRGDGGEPFASDGTRGLLRSKRRRKKRERMRQHVPFMRHYGDGDRLHRSTGEVAREAARSAGQGHRVTIAARIRPIEDGNFGDHKSVGGGVSELRIDVGKGYRVYYTIRNNVVVILLCGGDKSSRQKDKQLARQMAGEL